MGIRNPNACTLVPVKHRFFISVSLHQLNNHLEKYFCLLFARLQPSSQKNNCSYLEKIFGVGALPHCVPRVTPTVVVF